MLTYTHYLLAFAIGTAMLLAAAVSFNIVVDPYHIFGAPRIEGFNYFKPDALARARISKLYQVERIKPKGLIVGNSRPQMGLAPDHACWPSTARPVYNMAVPGLSVYKQIRYAQHSMVAGRQNLVVVGVDFLDFLWSRSPSDDPGRWPPADTEPGNEPFAIDPLGNPTGKFHWTRFADYVAATLSLDALNDSVSTVVAQHRTYVNTLRPDGFHPGDRLYRPMVNVDGVKVLFQQKNRQIAARLSGEQWYLFSRGKRTSPDFEAIRQLINQGRASGTKTVLFINPYHAEYLLQLDAAGLWDKFETWKQRLAELAQAEGVALWDFSGFNRYSTEPLSSVAERGESLEWFWEPAHYRRELGDIMLGNIFRAHCADGHGGAPEFGVRLERAEANGQIERYLVSQREGRDQYKKMHPQVWARIQALVDGEREL